MRPFVSRDIMGWFRDEIAAASVGGLTIDPNDFVPPEHENLEDFEAYLLDRPQQEKAIELLRKHGIVAEVSTDTGQRPVGGGQVAPRSRGEQVQLLGRPLGLQRHQQQLGHANLAVTSKYLDHIAPEERIEALKARKWTA